MKRVTHINIWKTGSNTWWTIPLPEPIDLADGEELVVEGLDVEEARAALPLEGLEG